MYLYDDFVPIFVKNCGKGYKTGMRKKGSFSIVVSQFFNNCGKTLKKLRSMNYP